MNNAEKAIYAAQNEMSKKYRHEVYQKERNKYSEDYIDGVNDAGVLVRLNDEDEFFGIKHEKGLRAYRILDNTICSTPDVVKEIKIFRKYVPELMSDYVRLIKDYNMLIEAAKRQRTDSESKKYKRWTEAEDNELIELVCEPKLSILDISVTMGRTVPSIKTRVSKLVGLKRISQEIAGRFVGSINGIDSDCVLDGTLFKNNVDK